MARKTEPKVDRLHVDRRIRRILAFEIIFVFTLYLILFLVTNVFLGQQTKVTEQILSRFQITVSIQNLERLLAQHTTLQQTYRLNPTDQTYEELVKNNGDFAELLDRTKDTLDQTQPDEAARLSEEVKLSNQLLQNQLDILKTSNALLGREVLSPVAAHKQASKVGLEDRAVVTTNKSPQELEADLTRLTNESSALTANWRTIAEQDINRLKEKLQFSQLLRTGMIFFQAFLVILGLTIISYTYVLPSFENILKQVILQNEELLRADSMKTEFISIASHQLRTPLSVIKWSLSLILKADKKNFTEEQRESIAQAKASAETVIKLVGNLLNLSRIEQGRLEHHPQETDIIPIIKEIVKDAKAMADKKEVKVSAEYPQEKIVLTLDPLLFKEVVQNLVDNAIAYNRPKGTIRVIVKKKDANWLIHVADTGFGIAPEDMKNLFTKFYRGSNARAIRPDGSGLGLYFIKRIVQIHGGRISVESEQNKGTVFTVTFPVHGKKTKSTPEIPGLTPEPIKASVHLDADGKTIVDDMTKESSTPAPTLTAPSASPSETPAPPAAPPAVATPTEPAPAAADDK